MGEFRCAEALARIGWQVVYESFASLTCHP